MLCHGFMICMWNMFLRPWSLEIACIQVALEEVVKHCIHISPLTGTASARKYTFEVRETWASCSRLQWAGISCFYSSICIPQKKWGRPGSFIRKVDIWKEGPIFEYVRLSLKVTGQMSSLNPTKIWCSITMVEHLNWWSMVCLLYAVAPPPYVCPRAHKNGWLE